MSEPNRKIGCSVDSCIHHCADCNYCTLDKIEVGTHEANPTKCECTDCRSFSCKN